MSLIDTLDDYLLQTLSYLFTHWYEDNTGIVACCLKDQDKVVFATSTRNGVHWLHAERNAYHKYQLAYGEPSENAIFITTLSPCIQSLKYRNETSCTKLIMDLGVKHVHFGVLDTMHVSHLTDYEDLGLLPSITGKQNLHEMCSKLMSMFSLYDSKINSELLVIKQSLGDDFFACLKNRY